MEFGRHDGAVHALGLVDSQEHRTAAAAQAICDHLVLWRQALPAIHQKNDDIGFIDGQQRLARHFHQNAGIRQRLETTGVHHKIGKIADHPTTVMPVARQPRQVCNQRITRLGQSIEQCGFADIGSADQYESR
ncbi:hypothetical protein GALL_423490 [mine drainage metagenome]|uniref:Uncharacterized protein n=1 Tax=mine drainage metagenome TaxID=410659 RepID=A0A1J5PY30_9ZZZZ